MGQLRPYLLGMRFGGDNLLCYSLNDIKSAPNLMDRGGKSERTQTCNAALRWERDMLPPCAVALCRCCMPFTKYASDLVDNYSYCIIITKYITFIRSQSQDSTYIDDQP